jgi:hypothetical protein
MKKLLLISLFLLTFSSSGVIFAQDDKNDRTMQNEQQSTAVLLSVSGNRVRVQHATQGTMLEVYNILGVKVSSVRIESLDETVTLDLPKGFYILKIGQVARKIVLR